MKDLQVPEFSTYEAEVDFWDNLDTADLMEDNGQWFRFETPHKRAIRVAILPEVAEELSQKAHAQGISIETLVNTDSINLHISVQCWAFHFHTRFARFRGHPYLPKHF